MTSKKISKKPSHSEAHVAKKDTVYIDVEDEITAVIDKVASSKSTIIAVVLPKHASVFQSIVNMKLLKKAADSTKKRIVLITSDTAVMSIAATVGLHIAKTSSSKPAIPIAATATSQEEVIDEVEGDLIVASAATAATTLASDNGPIELDNTLETSTGEQASGSPTKNRRKLSIPDFSSFRVKLLLGSGVFLALLLMWVFGFVILPKATISITTDTSSVPVDTSVTLQVGAENVDLEKSIIPAKGAQIEKTKEATVSASGEKNIGAKATGVMNVTNCINDGENKVIPSGTAFSSGSTTFLTTEAVTLDFAIFAGSSCLSGDFGRDKDVAVIAAEAGPEYNLGAQSYNAAIDGINAFGSAMSGGTTEIVKIISKEDVDRAKQESSGSSKSEAIEELQNQLSGQSVRAVDESLTETAPKVTVSPDVGEEADEVTVKTTITYAMLGVNEDDVSALIDAKINEVLEGQDKNIRDNGLTSARYTVVEQSDAARQVLSLKTVGNVGPEFDEEALSESVVGKKRGDIEKQLEAIDGVRSVSVEYSPIWITTTPKSAQKIKITFNEQDDQ